MKRKNYANFEEKLTCGLEIDLRNWASFQYSTWRCQNCDFHGILLSKVEKVWAEELCVMTMMNNAKFEEELTCHFKNDMRSLTNFDSSTQSLKNLCFNWLLVTKVYNVWAKKSTKELYLMALKIDAKFKGKVTCAFKNDMRNLANMHRLK